ncbi:sensor of ECF-type sigma factor [Tenacibaculum soleae]|uniref:sensor of ECF-type sigma factor n=1 Tax=Tenacibaculum soleae TaxID=447689 RepID=UPI002300F7D6|nr:sensor of ECF-type sigma factor [Tenacibaculum soleae]
MMKKNIFLLFLMHIAFLNSFTTKAQTKKDSSDKIRAYKIAFLTEKLNLTETEAQKFWPIYNKYDKKRMELHKEERYNIKKKILKKGGIDELSDKDSQQILKTIQSIDKQQHEIKTLFQYKLSKILSSKKILTLKIAEHEFNRKLMRKYRTKKNKKRS